MKAFVLTQLAARDLNEIWDYLASDSIAAADRILTALEKRCVNWQRIQAKAIGEKILPTAGINFFSFIPI